MKKLIVLASSLAIACGLQAASYTWGFGSSDIMDSTGNYIDGGTAFLYLGTVTASENAFDYSSATFIVSGGQQSDYSYGSMGAKVSSDLITSTAAGQAYTLILLENTGVTSLAGYEGNYILSTGTSSQGVNPMDDTDTWAVFNDPTAYGQAAWQTMSAVPEPTSGLLLLLGMAGLALKRKRA